MRYLIAVVLLSCVACKSASKIVPSLDSSDETTCAAHPLECIPADKPWHGDLHFTGVQP